MTRRYNKYIDKVTLVTLAVTLSLLAGTLWWYLSDIRQAKEEFRSRMEAEAQTTAHDIGHVMVMLYQGLRTLARLPVTRMLNADASNLDRHGRQSMQEVYNNLYSNISLSEVYLIQKGFDADRVNPSTGKPSSPMLTFDRYIVGKTALGKAQPANDEIEEIEDFEYRVMQQQMARLQAEYADEKAIVGLAYPAITSAEVLTCDNSQYSPLNPREQDRMGIVYSLPVFDVNGRFHAMVSGVILSNVLRTLLPSSHYVLRHRENGITVLPDRLGGWQYSSEQIAQGVPNEGLIYSSVIRMPIKDISGDWLLWVGVEEDEFWRQPQIQALNLFMGVVMVAVLLLGTLVLFIMRLSSRQRMLVQHQNGLLELRVRKRTAKLREANRRLEMANHAKAEFLSRVSHELRTPLNAIIGYSELIMEDSEEAGLAHLVKDSHRVHSAGVHLLALIDEVLDISKIEAGHMELCLEPFEIRRMVESLLATVAPLMEKNGNRFRIKYLAEPGRMIADQGKLCQILLNLLSNAAKFTQEGEVCLEIDSIGHPEQGEVRFCITDTGIGMSPAQLERIFDEFIQADTRVARDYGGTGLGLAISRRLCELMGGKIDVSSEEGQGSVFCVDMPRLLEQPSTG